VIVAKTAAEAAKWLKGLARRGVAPAALGTAVLLVVTAAATLGGNLPTTRLLPAPPSLELNVGPDPSGLTFPAVTDQFLVDALGPDAGAFIPTPAPTTAGPLPRGTSSPPTVAPGPDESASPSPSPRTRLPGPFQFSQLTIAMRADRSQASPGETITYLAIVTNTGTQDFRGAYQLSAHIPFGTVDATTPCDGTLGIDPQHDCVNPPVPTPGSPDPDVHQLNSSFSGTIPRGARQVTVFKVRVNETTQPGSRLQNHTHLNVVGDNQPTTTSNTVVVVVRR
jgi:uncharacterized repeat protein (TIGR01451 family)